MNNYRILFIGYNYRLGALVDGCIVTMSYHLSAYSFLLFPQYLESLHRATGRCHESRYALNDNIGLKSALFSTHNPLYE